MFRVAVCFCVRLPRVLEELRPVEDPGRNHDDVVEKAVPLGQKPEGPDFRVGDSAQVDDDEGGFGAVVLLEFSAAGSERGKEGFLLLLLRGLPPQGRGQVQGRMGLFHVEEPSVVVEVVVASDGAVVASEHHL